MTLAFLLLGTCLAFAVACAALYGLQVACGVARVAWSEGWRPSWARLRPWLWGEV